MVFGLPHRAGPKHAATLLLLLLFPLACLVFPRLALRRWCAGVRFGRLGCDKSQPVWVRRGNNEVRAVGWCASNGERLCGHASMQHCHRTCVSLSCVYVRMLLVVAQAGKLELELGSFHLGRQERLIFFPARPVCPMR